MNGLEPTQELATDPRAHASLSASAGTGKTHVLTSRLLRLLLGGVAPETILCLTFTKAGAAAMAERLGERLARWVTMDDRDLFKELEALGEKSGPEERKLARTLFARMLEAPGGIRIQTIHAFAQALLAAFPAEAGINPGFKPIEGRGAQEMVMRTLAELLATAEHQGDNGLIADVAALSGRLGEKGAVDYVKRCAAFADSLGAIDPTTIEPRIRAIFGLPDCDIDEFLAQQCGDDSFDCALLHAVADANRAWGAASGTGFAAAIAEWLSCPPRERVQSLELLRKVVINKDGSARKVSKGQLKVDPDYQDKADQLEAKIRDLLAFQNGKALAGDVAAGLRAGRAFALSYAAAKRAAGVADFDDLIHWTRRLLEQSGMAQWVRFKLDRRIDHLLIDEAQDTNADQWAIVSALADDFFSGANEADERLRTILMVGDFKQAIYGFQGTDPGEFERVRAAFKTRADDLRAAEDEGGGAGFALPFHDLAMATSFRSGQGVLDAVDAVIAHLGWEAMGLPAPPERHRAAAKNAHIEATVELWPTFAAQTERANTEDEEGFVDLRERQYATHLARQVKDWIESGEILGSTGRPVRPGDIMILVRSRAQLASLIVARLFAAEVPVAGIDRLHLNQPLAVKDLLAAMTFAVQPLDDLNLANLLVSPLVGWSQDDLMGVAAVRKGHLWPALRDAARDNVQAEAARGLLAGLLNMADFTTPAQFLETVLTGPMNGRSKLAGRLGRDSRDPIDELMTSALDFERDDIPSLERFIAWFSRGDVEIARDPSTPADEVRVMTVHGAKGLEAPIVILADAHFDPAKAGSRNGPVPIDLDGVEVPMLRPKKDGRPQVFAARMAALEKAELEEHFRLLYVGMTRAIERLVVAGLRPQRGEMSPLSWHNAVAAALDTLKAAERDDPRWGGVRRYERAAATKIRRGKTEMERPRAAPTTAIPDWATRPAPVEERPPRPLAPSAIAKDDVAAMPPGPALEAAAQRGIWIHALLERLVEVPPQRRRAAALRWLEQSAGVREEKLRIDMAGQVCAILSDPDFAPLFGPGSLGEAPLAATLRDGRVISGTVDRLLVQADRVWVIDFKTGRVPAHKGAIPLSHLAQMEAYGEALAAIFPGRAVRSALLYTAGPKLFQLHTG